MWSLHLVEHYCKINLDRLWHLDQSHTLNIVGRDLKLYNKHRLVSYGILISLMTLLMNKFIGIDIPTYFLYNVVWYMFLPNICVMDD